MIKRVLLSLLLIVITSPAWAMDVVRDGKPKAEIIVAQDAHDGIKHAANDLQTYIEKMSGAKLPIVNAPDDQFANRIYVGDSRHTGKLGYQLPSFTSSGYDILVTDDYAVLTGPNTVYPPNRYTKENVEEYQEYMGEKYALSHIDNGGGRFIPSLNMRRNDDIGAWHAVTALLERLGVRFYAPYENGTIVPQKKDIVLDPGRETKQAAFERRIWKHLTDADNEGNLWLSRLGVGAFRGVLSNHTTVGLIQYPEVRKLHPSWYAEESPGKLFAGARKNGGVPRFTDPSFIQACVDWARKVLDAYPVLSQITVGAPDESRDKDTGNPFDWRDVKLYQKPGMSRQQAYANMMWDFHVAIAKELKKSHPDKNLIWWCVYNDLIPTNIDPNNNPGNILARVEAVAPTNYVIDAKRKEFFDITKAKFDAFQPRAKTQQWEWWLDYWFPTSPRYPEFFMHRLQKTRQEQQKYFDGFFMEVGPIVDSEDASKVRRLGEVPLLHLMMYVNSKLLWNPNLDMDALLNEYYQLWFGPAANEMQAFHEYAEKVWTRQGSRSVSKIDGFLKSEDIPEYFELLTAAKAKTDPGSIYYQRIEALENGYSGLKTLFADRFPKGEVIEGGTLPNDTKVDGDFSKYQGPWHALHNDGQGAAASENKTAFKVALTKDKGHLFVAMRCDEESMQSLVEKTKGTDLESILKDDHIAISINTPKRSWFTIAINPASAILDETRDLDLINYYALPVFWTPGVKAHVKKLDGSWEVEVAIPTTDFGSYGPTADHPWGFNVRRGRMAGGMPETQSFKPERPADWARLVIPGEDKE